MLLIKYLGLRIILKKSHGLAIKNLVRYLCGTSRDKGMILSTSTDFVVDCYVDVDFAGLYPVENSQDAVSVRSCTWYIYYLWQTAHYYGSVSYKRR